MIDLLNKIDAKVCERKSIGLTCTEIFLSREEKEQISAYLSKNKQSADLVQKGDTAQLGNCTLFGMKVRLVDDEIYIR